MRDLMQLQTNRVKDKGSEGISTKYIDASLRHAFSIYLQSQAKDLGLQVAS